MFISSQLWENIFSKTRGKKLENETTSCRVQPKEKKKSRRREGKRREEETDPRIDTSEVSCRRSSTLSTTLV